jgi:hypothetical protein
MTTRNLLQRAATIAHEHGRDAACEGNQVDADRAYAVADELDKLAETADLRDELWEAAKAFAKATKHYDAAMDDLRRSSTLQHKSFFQHADDNKRSAFSRLFDFAASLPETET